ncbi:MAG: acyl--CoA ligase [Deltaproteobacteria bacterium]|nr:acyl--CoA ligase [Deltaproteobacteria bacterium]
MPRELHRLLLDSADRLPDAPFIIRGDSIATYGDVATRARRFASVLRGWGVKKGDRVAIVLGNIAEYPVAYYGTALAGGVAVPLSDDPRSASLVSTLHHAGARVLVIGGRNLRLLNGQAHALPDLEAIVTVGPAPALPGGGFETVPFESAVACSEEWAGESASGHDPVSIQYTSGTTGAKKGVVLTHENLRTNTDSIVEYLELTNEDRVGLVLPFYYVYGGSVLHTHVAVGASLAMLGSLAFPIRVAEGLARHRCTGFSGVPSTFARLLALKNLADHDLSTIRYLTQAGAAMSKEMAARVCTAFPEARLFVMYGQTEASARLSYLPPDRIVDKAGSVGFGIPGVELKVRDPEGRECAPGETGEVVARGANITSGYFNNPDATRRFIRDDGLHTADLSYFDDDGFLFLVGRESEMIKSGAHRIAPKEIEEIIENAPGVSACAVVGRPNELLGQVPVAFIVPSPDSAPPARQDILRHCRDKLSRFKIPKEMHFVDDLPKTANGKLLRRALRDRLAAQGPTG